ncbi:hypothetical protein GYMLUDRAFT_55663 [Collybiopsis luxurians FD-317 M1]|nr:hypothetical protein GYMLUDRAFT_55663 [Collybiopsis luxurians FD-317 M1]
MCVSILFIASAPHSIDYLLTSFYSDCDLPMSSSDNDTSYACTSSASGEPKNYTPSGSPLVPTHIDIGSTSTASLGTMGTPPSSVSPGADILNSRSCPSGAEDELDSVPYEVIDQIDEDDSSAVSIDGLSASADVETGSPKVPSPTGSSEGINIPPQPFSPADTL